MQIKQLATVLSAATLLASVHTSALSETYQFQILANPDALEATADPSLDVLHTITIDSSKIPSFTSATLRSTEYWLNGGITMTMTHNGKSVVLNDGLDPNSATPSVPGSLLPGIFIDLGAPNSHFFFALEFAPDTPFIDDNDLPYDPFVYGFLFAYQDQQPYQDFRSLWTAGNTGVLSGYVAAVPEANTALTFLLGLGLMAGVARRKFKR